MADLVTVGALAASALAMASEAALKGAVSEAIKDAWKALKGTVAKWAGNDLENLEKSPTSIGRQTVVAEAIDERSEEEKVVALSLARQLTAALRASSPIGLDVRRLEALEVQLGEITVTEGIGVRIDETTVAGKFATGPIKVGPSPGKI